MKLHKVIAGLVGLVGAILMCATLGSCAGAPAAPAAPKSGAETYYLLVFNQPVAGQEAEYNDWYDHQHAPDVVSVPGFVSARRYVLAEDQLRPPTLIKPRYVVIYKIVTTDLTAVYAEVGRRIRSGETRMTAIPASSRTMFSLSLQILPRVWIRSSTTGTTSTMLRTYSRYRDSLQASASRWLTCSWSRKVRCNSI